MQALSYFGNRLARLLIVALAVTVLANAVGPELIQPALAANPSGDLEIKVITAYNFIVDSNVDVHAYKYPDSNAFEHANLDVHSNAHTQ